MPELIPIFLFLCIASVLILRPITKRAGILLEQLARERAAPPAGSADTAMVRGALEHLGRRLDLMEERLDFTERLLASRPPAAGALGSETANGELRLRRPG